MLYLKVEITILVIIYPCNKVFFVSARRKKDKMKITKNLIICFLITLTTVQSSFAQDNDGLEGLVEDTKSDLLIVVGGGLAGAVLGLSTLSFVEEPKDHTRNIIVGASIGIIAGVAYVAFSQANKSREAIYGTPEEEAYYNRDSKSFDTTRRISWHRSQNSQRTSPIATPYALNYSFKY